MNKPCDIIKEINDYETLVEVYEEVYDEFVGSFESSVRMIVPSKDLHKRPVNVSDVFEKTKKEAIESVKEETTRLIEERKTKLNTIESSIKDLENKKNILLKSLEQLDNSDQITKLLTNDFNFIVVTNGYLFGMYPKDKFIGSGVEYANEGELNAISYRSVGNKKVKPMLMQYRDSSGNRYPMDIADTEEEAKELCLKYWLLLDDYDKGRHLDKMIDFGFGDIQEVKEFSEKENKVEQERILKDINETKKKLQNLESKLKR